MPRCQCRNAFQELEDRGVVKVRLCCASFGRLESAKGTLLEADWTLGAVEADPPVRHAVVRAVPLPAEPVLVRAVFTVPTAVADAVDAYTLALRAYKKPVFETAIRVVVSLQNSSTMKFVSLVTAVVEAVANQRAIDAPQRSEAVEPIPASLDAAYRLVTSIHAVDLPVADPVSFYATPIGTSELVCSALLRCSLFSTRAASQSA